MSGLQNLPIREKLIFVILATCTCALLPACIALAAFELYDFRRTMAREMTVVADILALNARAAIAFQDDAEARKKLETLAVEPHVMAACLYLATGPCFAEFVRPGAQIAFPVRPEKDGHWFSLDSLILQRPIMLNEKRIGAIYIQSDLGRLYEWLGVFGGIVVLALSGSVLLVFMVSSRMQRMISEPILALAEAARKVAARRDYSLRARKFGDDEVGELAVSFNGMLEQIQRQDSALQGEIAERNAAEQRIKEQLERLKLLDEVTRSVGERMDLQSIFQVVVRTLENSLPADFCCVGMRDEAGDGIRIARVGVKSAALAMELAVSEGGSVGVKENGLERCMRGELVYQPDIGRLGFPFLQRLAAAGLRSVVMAPLRSESSNFGLLVAARQGVDGFSSVECEFLRQVSEHVALAASQAQLHGALQMAYDDLRQTQVAAMQEERLRALGQMASGIAHDINNALSPVSLYTESLLEKEEGLSERARGYLEVIQRSVEDVAQTVARMREFYRQREPQLELAPVSVNHLVQQVLDLTRARWSDMAHRDGISIRPFTELTPDLPEIMGVESEIREALTNLVFNAVDAMPKGGTLTLRTRRTSAAAGVKRDAVVIEISDDGVGMDDETRRRCLEPFFTTKGERGTGLGLAMVFGMVQRHSADLEIDSSPGAGSSVRLVFAVPEPVDAVAGEQRNEIQGLPQLRLLLIDDDPVLLNSLRSALVTDGHVIVAASGGAEGIATFRAALGSDKAFSAVITDLGMPHVDGRKVAAAVKEGSISTPVILLTGWGQRLILEGDIPAQVDQVLAKPPKLREIRQALARCCGLAV